MKTEKDIKEVEAFLDKHKISGIIKLPGAGTFCLFQSIGDKLLVLEEAMILTKARQKLIDADIEGRTREDQILNFEKKPEPSYIR